MSVRIVGTAISNALFPAAGDEKKPACSRCQKSGDECIRGASKIRFRHGSSARYDSEFSKDQTWLSSTSKVNFEYIDETPELANHYAQEELSGPVLELVGRDRSISSSSDPAVALTTSHTVDSEPPTPSQLPRSHTTVDQLASPTKRRRIDDIPLQFSTYYHASPDASASVYGHSPHASLLVGPSPTSSGPLGSVHESARHSDDHGQPGSDFFSRQTSYGSNGPLSSRSWRQQPAWPQIDLQEACLMRYWVENLARWFDLCDAERHFETICPQRARSCPALLYAIYAASARHLTRLDRYKFGNAIRYHDKILPDLKIETAVYYHNLCIQHLMSIAEDPEAALDENLLAAAVILRFYEEVDLPLTGEEHEIGLPGIQALLHAQADLATQEQGLRHAAFWVACRQEIYSAFMKQRPFRMPLGPFEKYRSFDPAPDDVWSDRLVVYCADVLQYCYDEGLGTLSAERWEELVSFDQKWVDCAPPSFAPIYTRDPDKEMGELFPEIWFLTDCHVTGIQHVELARILLAVYNPKVPRLGPGQRVAAARIEHQIKEIVLRLCGIAESNRRVAPAFVTACMGIAMCGDRFAERDVQERLLSVLIGLEVDHAWPTDAVQRSMKEAWGWEIFE